MLINTRYQQCVTTYKYQEVHIIMKQKSNNKKNELTELVTKIFKESRNIYGQRKIKIELQKLGLQVSRRRIGCIMKEQYLISKYTLAQFKQTKTTCNESEVGNILNREFQQTQELKVVVSDLTYVKVNKKW